MNITVLFIFLAIMHVHANVYGQKLTLKQKRVSIARVFEEIEKQTGYDVFYSPKIVKTQKIIDANFNDTPLDQVLKLCLANQPLTYVIEEKTIVIKEKTISTVKKRESLEEATEMPQQNEVRGRVVDSLGNPLQGASVEVKGHNLSTITNSEGEFILLNVPEDVKLEISFLGYEKLIVNARINLGEITLTMISFKLDESEVTISTGYQNLPRERTTGSFSSINNERFNEQISTDVLSRLESIGNSVNVNRVTTGGRGITVRGVSSIMGATAPLIVLDNFPYDGDLDNINPNDVENITFLKDAAAASIWGTRAGNGVIVITTKKGRYDTPFQVEATANLTIGAKPDLFYPKNMSTNDHIDVEEFLFNRGFAFSDTSSFGRLPFTPVYETLFRQQKGLLNAEQTKHIVDSFRRIDVRDEYRKHMYSMSVNHQYAVNLSGGSDKLAWYFSSGYDRNLDVSSAGFERVNMKYQNSYTPIKNLQINTSMLYTSSTAKTGKPSFGEIRMINRELPSYTRFMDDQGNPIPIAMDFRKVFTDTAGSRKLLDWGYYPADNYNHEQTTSTVRDVLATFNLNYKMKKGFRANIMYQYENQQGRNESLMDEEGYTARNLINQFTSIDPLAGAVRNNIPLGGILDLGTTELASHNLRTQIDYDKHIGNHHMVGLIGAEIRDNKATSSLDRTYGYSSKLLTVGNVDFANPQRNFVTGSNSFIPNPKSFTEIRNRFVSAFANMAYTWNGTYTLTLSGRRDASNIFGVNTNDKWNILWSAGGGWILSNERFYNFDLLPYLKLRATYGYSGNVDPNRSAVTTIAYRSASPYTLLPTAIISRDANPDLRWERVGMLNLGIDFRSKEERLTGSVEFYQKRAIDLFGPWPMDYTTGLDGTYIINAAGLNGAGFDAELNTINTKGKVQWISQINLSVYKEKVAEYYKDTRRGSDYVTGISPNISGVVGKPLYAMMSYRWGGLDPQNGSPIGYINGLPSTNYVAITGDSTLVDDLVYAGSALPTLFGSIGNSLTWKNFTLTARLMYKFGYYYRRQSVNYTQLFSNGMGHLDYANRWQQPGDENQTQIPSMMYPVPAGRDVFYGNSEILVERGDHIRLQYITLSYDLNNRFGKLPFSNARLYANVNNLGIIWRANKEGVDPEYGAFGLLPPKTFTLGFRLIM